MFNLEQKISDWRRLMLAAGIKSPVPLEELEIHLREEIEQQMKSELSGQEAFEIAVRRIGKIKNLKTEFKKLEKQDEHIIALVLAAAACLVSVFAGFRVIFWSVTLMQTPADKAYVAGAMSGVWLGLLMVIAASYATFICIRKMKRQTLVK